MLYQNLLLLFASVLTSGVVLFCFSRDCLQYYFGWTPGLDDNFKVTLFFSFVKAEMGRSILIYRLNHKYWSAKGLTLRSTQKCWVLCACRLPCGIPASNLMLLFPALPWELLWSYFAFIPEDFLPICIIKWLAVLFNFILASNIQYLLYLFLFALLSTSLFLDLHLVFCVFSAM